MAAAVKRRRTRGPLDDLEPVGFTDAPTEDESRSLTELGRELLETERHIADLERELSAASKKRHEIRHEKLPQLMEKIGQNKIGLGAVEILLEPFYHANISADWPEEMRQAAFDYLEQQGAGELIKLLLTYSFRRGELESARLMMSAVDQVADLIRRVRADAGIEEEFTVPQATVREEVHHMTLTAWVRERTEAGESLDLERIGATVGQIAKVKKQK